MSLNDSGYFSSNDDYEEEEILNIVQENGNHDGEENGDNFHPNVDGNVNDFVLEGEQNVDDVFNLGEQNIDVDFDADGDFSEDQLWEFFEKHEKSMIKNNKH
uniref:Uncharacterized protein n=1 Tax=Panagrolaimus sp. ES5 TaxID=591445 RepID=A0AC34G556_9BILA